MFSILISDLYYGSECMFIRFAKDTKKGGLAEKTDGCAIQRHLDRLEKYANRSL